MSWLPAIRFAGNRYWLPLSRPAADLVAAVLLDPQAAGTSLVSDLAQQLRSDPPLAIYAALCLARERQGKCNANDAADFSIDEIAVKSVRRIPHWFTSSDAVLGAPEDRERLIPQWLALQESFLSMPPSKWLAAAGQWLELTGPPIPATIRQNWPRIVDAPSDAEPSVRDVCPSQYAETKLDLPQMARKLRRAKRLSSTFRDAVSEAKQGALKQLAYGLSHEINNPLANISVRAQGLMRNEDNAERKASLQRVVDQAMRAHEMVADLMFFSHPPAPHLTRVDLTAVLSQVAHQIGTSVADRGIEVRVCQPEPAVTLQADRAMMAEAARALIRNAVEAIGCDGRIDVQCSLQGDNNPPVASIVVRDSGPGLSEAAQQHAFDPYFSGREAGRGLGVGLCRVKRIAQLHGGGVSLSSGPAGCIARVWIPAQA